MEELYKLKDLLCDELEQYGKKGELSAGSLDIIDKLSHALKSITAIISMDEEGEYSGRAYPMMYARNGRSYAGRMNAKRGSNGRYSRGYSYAVDDMIMQLREMMEEAPDATTRAEIQKLVTKMENM